MLLVPRHLEKLAERSRRPGDDSREVLEDWMRETGGNEIDAWLAHGDWFVWPNDEEECFEVLVYSRAPRTVHGVWMHQCARPDGSIHAEATLQRHPIADVAELDAISHVLGLLATGVGLHISPEPIDFTPEGIDVVADRFDPPGEVVAPMYVVQTIVDERNLKP